MLLALTLLAAPFETMRGSVRAETIVKNTEECDVEFGNIFSVQCKVSYSQAKKTGDATSPPVTVTFNQLSYFNSYRINPKLIINSYQQKVGSFEIAQTMGPI